jgi:hypothetical protein
MAMQSSDYTILIVMGLAAAIAAGSFSAIARYLFDHGLADRNAKAPNMLVWYKTYMAQTRKQTGRIGTPFWCPIYFTALFLTVRRQEILHDKIGGSHDRSHHRATLCAHHRARSGPLHLCRSDDP